MQYILTQAEYDALTPIKRLQDRNEALEKAKGVILGLSNHVCIHDKGGSGRNSRYCGYCDDCPMSFNSIGHEASKLICELPKDYSK